MLLTIDSMPRACSVAFRTQSSPVGFWTEPVSMSSAGSPDGSSGLYVCALWCNVLLVVGRVMSKERSGMLSVARCVSDV